MHSPLHQWNRTIQTLLLIFITGLNTVYSQAIIHYFNGSGSPGKVYLEWQMVLGNTCDGIRILHSKDSIQFNEIGLIGGICGSKTETVKYNFTHETPVINGKNYYQLEFGNVLYSEVIQIELVHYSNGYQIRPHPINQNAQILFDGKDPPYRIEFINNQGTLIAKKTNGDTFFDIHAMDFIQNLMYFRIYNAKGLQLASGKIIIL